MKKCLLFLLLLVSANVFSQFSKTHYIPPLSSSVDVVPEDQYLYISTPSITPVNFRIINLGGGVQEGTVSRDAPYVADIGFGEDTQLNVGQSQVNQVLSNKGYIVEGDDLIYVSARVIAGNSNQAGVVVSKGLAALGKEFRIGAFLNELTPNYGSIHYTFVSILATENNTHVSFSGIAPGVILINNASAGNTPSDIVLNSGQSFVMAVQGPHNANRAGLIGALVSSDKPIAVNCGSFGGTNGELVNLDLGFDQIVSAERTGTDYIFIRGTGMDAVERILLVADQDNTDIFLGGNPTPVTTLNAGQWYSLQGNAYSANGNLYVHCSKNVFAYQSIGDNTQANQANQELFFVPPLSCQTPKAIDNIPFLNQIGDRVFSGRVTLVTETGSSLSFIIDGVPYTLASLPAGNVDGPSSIPGNPGFETYTIIGLSGNVSVFSSSQLYLASYGSSANATFGGFYSGFTFKPEVAFNNVDITQANCIPNITLSVSAITAFNDFQWYFNDVAIPGATNRDYTPTQPGYYYVSATIAQCGITLISDKIPVSSCANDMDSDLTDDNIDIDNDNDGILNCTESLGDMPFNLTNPLAGSTVGAGYGFTGNFPPGFGTPSPTPFIGTASGNFITETTAGKGNSVIYNMNFAQPVSISLDYASAANPGDLINPNEEFIISVPPNRTITVKNPDNQLLIDTNYDGIYESNVTQFSSFEIRFRVNGGAALAAGSGTFRFQSYLAGSFTFTHKNLLDDAPSKATFRIVATCVPKDSDNDTVPDQLDLDSDNDGITDLYESQGQNFTPLTHVDDNHDGLDNAFGNGISPADSDNDGVANYLDLDSDNDGIFDLFEAGSNPPDFNHNGVIDGATASFGANGLSSSVETAPDNGILDYSLVDTDTDGLFNYIDLDSDSDGCNDSREAGYSDGNNDGILGTITPPAVNALGMVTGASSGYTPPLLYYVQPRPIIVITQPQDVLICENQTATFSILTNAGADTQWQVSTDGGITFTSIPSYVAPFGNANGYSLNVVNVTAAMQGWKFRVLLSSVGNLCGGVSNTVTLNVNPLPPAITRTLVQCDTGANPDGITIFNLAQALPSLTQGYQNISVEFYESVADAQSGTAPLSNDYTNLSNPQQLAVKMTDTTTGCFVFSTLILSVNVLPNQIVNLPQQCEDLGQEDGFMIFDLTSANIPGGPTQTVRYYENETDALLEQNQLADPAHYHNLTPYGLQTVYARRETGNDCSRLYLINIKVNPLPDIDQNLGLAPVVVCVNSTTFSVPIDAALLDGSLPSAYTYQWYFEGNLIPGAHGYSLTVNAEGTYSVIVTDANGCSKTRTIPVVASSQAIIENVDFTEMSDDNTVTVTLTSNSYGDYVYAIDHQNAGTPSNVIQHVPPGIHTVYVMDLNGCPSASQEISILGIPKYFTPNGDGFNDTWNVKGVNDRFHSGTRALIFDRYGKLIKEIGGIGNGWDGTFNGQPLPSDDYWYVVTFETGKVVKGHFALKR
ncbi:MAG: T9SS type B sorting domain-containing protein [Flavobacterium sp.]|nr:MAG: T9SS type B sorting domain-containing protein [Flavobacterium sp.]